MKSAGISTVVFLLWMVAARWVCAEESQQAPGPNHLSAADQAAGWRLLFDGRTLAGWRGYGKKTIPGQGWVVEEGWLKKVGGVRGGDIITQEEFTDFELEWEWRISARGNNGVKYFVSEGRGQAIGHEYQMLDDLHGSRGKGSTASFYGVLAARPDKPLKPAGEINHSRILVRGNHVEHWLNGVKVLAYECGSEEVRRAVAKSKFGSVEGFGAKIRGHILLTDHGSQTWFRNVKVR